MEMTEENKTINSETGTNKLPLKGVKLPKVDLKMAPLKLNMKVLGAIFLVMLLGVGSYYVKGFFVAAVVNGKPITRVALIKELQKQGGKQVLESMILKELLLQEAAKNKIVVTPADIQVEMKSLEGYIAAQGTTLDQFLQAQNITKKDLDEGLRIKIIQDKLVANEATVTEAEVNSYIEQNKDALPKGQDMNELKAQIQKSLQQQKTQEASQALLTKLKAQAKILYW